jgi:hypothetical protein
MFDFDDWHRALADVLEPWQAAVLHVGSLNFPHEDEKQLEQNRPRRQRMVEDLLRRAIDHGVRVTDFREPLLLAWYNKLFHFYQETGAQPVFFTDNTQVPGMNLMNEHVSKVDLWGTIVYEQRLDLINYTKHLWQNVINTARA